MGTLAEHLQGAYSGGPDVFLPSDLGGVSVWLRADKITGLADAAVMDTWVDTGGKLNSPVGSGTARPTYRTNVLNGKPVVRFDGVDDGMIVANNLTMRTMFAVVSHSDGGASFTDYRRLYGGWGTTPNDISFLGMTGNSIYNPNTAVAAGYSANTSWINGVNSVSAAPLANFKVVSAISDASWTSYMALGTYLGSAATLAELQCFKGDMAEFIMFDFALSTYQRRQVEAYLGTKYAVAVT